MSENKVKQKYNPKHIYFGCLTYNVGRDGYYKSQPEAFIRKTDENGDIVYQCLTRKGKYSEYTKNTEKYLTISDAVCLAELVPEEKKDQYTSMLMIRLHLLKQRLNWWADKNIRITEYDDKQQKTKK